MTVCLLLLLEPWTVVYGRAALEQLHSYDLEMVRAEVTPAAGGGLDVVADLQMTLKRPGPVVMVASAWIRDLEAASPGTAVTATLGAGVLDEGVRLAAPAGTDLPTLLTIRSDPPLPVGKAVTIRLQYRWRPRGDGWSYAGSSGAQTHLSGFWLPVMAHETFQADISLKTPLPAVGPGVRTREGDAWRFRSKAPVQLTPLLYGDFTIAARTVDGRRLEVWTPPGVDWDAEAALDDTAAVLKTLEGWFGKAVPDVFRVLVDPRLRPMPSYCAGTFTVIHRSRLPAAVGRARWLALLAHECSHVWWGYRFKTPIVGGGGTWLREGLAQWSGIEVAGALLGPGVRQQRYDAMARAYLGLADLRRNADGSLFANEASLRDASYLDDALVPYVRGALVWRRLAEEIGAERFRGLLREWAQRDADQLYDWTILRDQEELAPLVAYYAATSRVPDLVLDYDGKVATVTATDGAWPGGTVGLRVERKGKTEVVRIPVRNGRGSIEVAGPVERLELDPRRVHLDPVRSNSIWPR
ncbi:MAG: hypothetical protein OER88_03550 [Planctomycetota bacterium]|nr:hypothetical protein [Planctomycetota bacterium]